MIILHFATGTLCAMPYIQQKILAVAVDGEAILAKHDVARGRSTETSFPERSGASVLLWHCGRVVACNQPLVALQTSVRAGAVPDPGGAEAQPARAMAKTADRTDLFLMGDFLVMVEKR